MAFREKMAWVSLMGILLAFIPYFAFLTSYDGPAPFYPLYSSGLLAGIIVLLTIVVTITAIVAALSNIRDAQAPADERDRRVACRASAVAYSVLLPCLFAALATAFFGWSLTAVANAVLAAIIVAELVRNGLEIAGYRGWHG